jgi:hypothetical protein
MRKEEMKMIPLKIQEEVGWGESRLQPLTGI